MTRPLLLILVLFAAARCQSPGAKQAHRDIASNHLEIRTYGMPNSNSGEYRRLLEQRMNVKLQPVAGCMVTQEQVDTTRAYNKVMEAEIERRFGPDALTKLWEESKSAEQIEFEQTYSPLSQKPKRSP